MPYVSDNIRLGAKREATDQQRPSVLYRPALFADGPKWCALYGDNIAQGVAGFGDTPEQAMAAFDEVWVSERTPATKVKGHRVEDPEDILADLYNSEINWTISIFWDAGYRALLGDELNGFVCEESFPSFDQAVDYLKHEALRRYPQSQFAKNHAG